MAKGQRRFSRELKERAVWLKLEQPERSFKDVLRHADALLELPMRGGKTSLNVAMAAGIAMYSIANQLWGTPPSDLASRQDRPPDPRGRAHARRHVRRGALHPAAEPRLGTKLQ